MKTLAVTSKFLPGNLEEYCLRKGIEIIRLNHDVKSIEPKWVLGYRLLTDSFKCLRYLGRIRKARTILSVSHLSIALLFFRKAGLINKNTRLIWEGFFLHNKKFFPLFRLFFRHLFGRNDRLIVYSSFERELYSTDFNLDIEAIHCVPLVFAPRPLTDGDSEYSKRVDWEKVPSSYYFSGGYSHRDYPALINSFRGINAHLVICSSRLNTELNAINVPPNVTLLNDVSKGDFTALIRRSKACLLLIKSDSGAAGQLFAIEAMFYGKIVIASSTSVLKELISHKKNGFLVTDPVSDIPHIIVELEEGLAGYTTMGEQAKRSILMNHSKQEYDKHIDLALCTIHLPCEKQPMLNQLNT